MGMSVTGIDADEIEVSWKKWEPHIQKLEERAVDTPPPKDPILLLGSSTFTRWTKSAEELWPLPTVNHGFGGSDMLAVLTFYDRLVLSIRPRTLVLYEGGNDISRGVSPDTFLEKVKTFVEKINTDLPESMIVILSVQLKPAEPSTDRKRKEMNDLLVRYCATAKNVLYLDITAPTLGMDGRPRLELFGDDQFHFNAAGYKVLKDALMPVLAQVHGVRELRHEQRAKS